ncbi:MAG TPA: glutamyl-tRNA reductase [Bacteroidota bacterium]
MNLVLIGINHRTALLDVREKLWFSEAELPPAIVQLRDQFFSECFIVSTCNRTELYGIVDPQKSSLANESTIQAASDTLITLKSAFPSVRHEHLYQISGCRAAAHLFKVAGGIDSMVIGDIQILNQIKSHYNLASGEQTTGVFLHRLVQTALRVGKRARTETTICEGAVSVGYAAVELANKIFSDLSQKHALLIGAGETGELAAKNLTGRGIASLTIANRTRSKAEDLVKELGGNVVDFDRFEEALRATDVVICSVSSPQYILTPEQLQRVMKARSNAPLLIIDIGVPRNVHPDVNNLENVFLNDIDSLSRIVDQNLQRRKSEIASVNAIVLEELVGMRQWLESLQVHPTITDLRDFFENVRADEVRKHINRFTEQDKELVELLTKRIVNKLLHLPTTNLKNGDGESAEERHKKIHIVRGLFGLQKKDSVGNDNNQDSIE